MYELHVLETEWKYKPKPFRQNRHEKLIYRSRQNASKLRCRQLGGAPFQVRRAVTCYSTARMAPCPAAVPLPLNPHSALIEEAGTPRIPSGPEALNKASRCVPALLKLAERSLPTRADVCADPGTLSFSNCVYAFLCLILFICFISRYSNISL